MKLRAKGVLQNGYWAYGRKWPRTEPVEVTVSDEEGKKILADPHIVAVVVPEAPAERQRAPKG